MPFCVLKLGGSLIRVARELICRLSDLAQEDYSFLVVPGGGPMADLIRDLSILYPITQETMHWMAILAMEQYAYFLADGTCARLTNEIKFPAGRGIEILLPYQALLRDDGGLQHNWEFTSDAVAALAALRLEAPLVKVTDVDGVILQGNIVPEISASSLIGKKSCIDQGTLQILLSAGKGKSCWVLNGSNPSSFIASLKKGVGGTLIMGE